MSRLQSFLLTGACLLVMTACATGGTGGSNADRLSVTVENTATPPTAVVVWMEKDNGMRQRLGSVNPNEVATFGYNVPGTGQYRLLATTRAAGGDMASSYFTLTDSSSRVAWDIGARSVVVR